MNQRSYADDKKWEESWIPHVVGLLRQDLFFDHAMPAEDIHRVSDVMLIARDIRIGVRIRYPQHFDKKNRKNEITIRSRRDSGAKTEWEKIIEGGGDCLFYGFANPAWKHAKCIRRWTLISLHAIRRIVESGRCPPLNHIPNGDGTWFYALTIQRWMTLDEKFVLDRNWE